MQTPPEKRAMFGNLTTDIKLNNIVTRFKSKHQIIDGSDYLGKGELTRKTKDSLFSLSLPQPPQQRKKSDITSNDDLSILWKHKSMNDRRDIFSWRKSWTLDSFQVLRKRSCDFYGNRQEIRRISSMILFGNRNKPRQDYVVPLQKSPLSSVSGLPQSRALPSFVHRRSTSSEPRYSQNFGKQSFESDISEDASENDVTLNHIRVNIDVPIVEKRRGSELKFTVHYHVLKLLLESAVCKSGGHLTIIGADTGTERARNSSNVSNGKDSVSGSSSYLAAANHEKKNAKQVVEKMKTKPHDYVFQLTGCREMICLATEDNMDAIMYKKDGISAVVQALKIFLDKRELVYAGCNTLTKLTGNSDASCRDVCKVGGIPVICSILQKYVNDVLVLEKALDVLSNTSISEDDSINFILDSSSHSDVLSIIARYPQHVHVNKQCVYILGNISTTVTAAESVVDMGGVNAILGVMDRFKTEHEVLESCCRALGCLSIHDEVCMDVSNAGAVKSALTAMSSGEHVIPLQECGCWAIACLTKYDETCTEFCENDGINILTRILNRLNKEEAVQEYGSWTFCNIAAQDHLVNQIAREDVLTCLLDTMKTFATNIELQEQIFFAVSQIAMSHDERQEQLVSSGGIPTVLNIMTSFPDNQDLQAYGCRIIGNIAVKECLRQRIETDGATKAVISAMLTHDRNEEIQLYGCMALTNLTANVQENKVVVVKNSGVSGVLAAMKEMMHDDSIVMCGLKTLSNLMEIEDACFYFVDEDGIDVMRFLLQTYRKSHEVKMYTALVLSSLSSARGIMREVLDAAEDLLLEILTVIPDDEEVNLCLCHFYENMVLTDHGCERFLDRSCMTKLKDIIHLFPYNTDLQLSVCKTIAAVAIRNQIRRCCDEDIVTILLSTMTILRQHTDILIVCCGALSFMVEQDDEFRHCIKAQRGVTVVLDCLQDHTHDERLLVVGMMFLDSVLGRGIDPTENQSHILKTVSDVMTNFTDNTEIQTFGCNVLKNIGKDLNLNQRRKSCDQVTNLLAKRHSAPELTNAAVVALQSLLIGQDEDVLNAVKNKLSFLDDDVWKGFSE